MLVPPNKRVCARAAVGRFNQADASVGGVNSYFTSAANVGPTITTTMIAFCAFTPVRPFLATANVAWLFGHAGGGGAAAGGFCLDISNTLIMKWIMRNGTDSSAYTLQQPELGPSGRTIFSVMVHSLAAPIGLSHYVNGTLIGTVASVFTVPDATTVTFVGSSAVGTTGNTGGAVMDCGVLIGYDGSTFVSSVFGNGITGLMGQWMEDLQQGRDLTWPRAAAANSDYYWPARDIANGMSVGPTWTDRYSSIALTRTGNPQMYSTPVRF